MPFFPLFPLPCRDAPPTGVPSPGEASAFARTMECDFDVSELNNITSFLGARTRAVDIVGSLAIDVNCTELAASNGDDFDLDVCVSLLAAAEASLSAGSICYQEMLDYAIANAARDASVAIMDTTRKQPDFLSVAAQCGNSDSECNTIDECKELEALCSDAFALLPALEAVLGALFRRQLLAVAAAALFAGVPAAVLAATAAVAIGAIVITQNRIGNFACDETKDACERVGFENGLTCQGLSCCPGETGLQCGVNCCCCPLYYAPSGATCECVPSM
ncbi:hypothetical protein FisN_2Lh113 [Fistulifera solaris]|uniref:Uncharacterized protein n=1 Tax=Fistulifera solaris TaxID=1519565 RepID=A0A1Z5JXA9_FISSO|nr:hypothetical protein FisN_2Lh113 [Fistulifera solaris]|eukprot:GAX18458.1 hypothetical protein FisN_2Lh113 [Fistulifera solaris]